MRLLRSLVVILLAIIGIVVILALYLASRGFSARSEPSRAEAFIARRVRSFAIPRKARDAVNPVRYGPEVLSESMKHFADHCAICHGNDGRGDTSLGRGLYPKPPDMRQSETQSLTDGEIYWIIHNGVQLTGMPAFGEDKPGVVDEDSWKLVHFIRHLPKISEDELQTMKQFNPKSPSEIQEEEAIRRFLAGEDSPSNTPAHHH
jgi:mono/diheme cytochrome c family protein